MLGEPVIYIIFSLQASGLYESAIEDTLGCGPRNESFIIRIRERFSTHRRITLLVSSRWDAVQQISTEAGYYDPGQTIEITDHQKIRRLENPIIDRKTQVFSS